MPPPTSSVLTRSSRLSITFSLSPIFAPPRIAMYGIAGLSRTRWNAAISLSSRRPAAEGRSLATPHTDAWSRCELPNASLTNTSPFEASSLAKS